MPSKDKTVRTHAQIVEFYKTGVREQRENESDLQYYQNLVDMANRRLRRLAKMESDRVYKGVAKFAYESAMYDIEQMTGKRMKGFSTKLPKTKDGDIDMRSYHARINAVKRFLESPTSTQGGINKVFIERAKTLNDTLNKGLDTPIYNLSWKDLANYWSNESAQRIAKNYASATILKAIATMSKTPTAKEINEVLEKNIKVSDDEIVDEVTKQLFRQGLKFSDLVS